MPARSAVSLLAASAPIRRPCLAPYYHPPPAFVFPTCSRLPGEFLSTGPRIIPPVKAQRIIGPGTVESWHLFHSTAARRDEAIDNARNHYETLKVTPAASASEIKKSFYSLSKAHHPDVHEISKRRMAAKRFMRISEAYSILSSPTKRAKYDRDHMNLASSSSSSSPSSSSSQTSPPPGARKGSYASTGPAGGRPASGLSRRRGTFQGPPPSFFRSGGWGAQGEKRRAAHEESTGGASSSSNFSSGPGPSGGSGGSGGGGGGGGGMGPGQHPYGHGGDVPHFDKKLHENTWARTDKRREARRANNAGGERGVIAPEKGIAGMFFLIGGMLLLSFVGPVLVTRLFYETGPNTRATKGNEPRGNTRGGGKEAGKS